MRPSWPDRLAPRAARRKARLLFVVLTVTGLAVCYGLSRSAPPDMCVFADYPAAVALGAPAAGSGGGGHAESAASTSAAGSVAGADAGVVVGTDAGPVVQEAAGSVAGADAGVVAHVAGWSVAHASAVIGEPGVPAPGDDDGGVLQVCAALLAVLVMLVAGVGGARDRRFLYALPRPLGPPHVRSRRRRGRAAPSLAALQILRV